MVGIVYEGKLQGDFFTIHYYLLLPKTSLVKSEKVKPQMRQNAQQNRKRSHLSQGRDLRKNTKPPPRRRTAKRPPTGDAQLKSLIRNALWIWKNCAKSATNCVTPSVWRKARLTVRFTHCRRRRFIISCLRIFTEKRWIGKKLRL